ncbi:hypothetical protein JHK85_007389 [Glycine max]|nr:hypothetical protein JHK85_007389 [Glycine max]
MRASELFHFRRHRLGRSALDLGLDTELKPLILSAASLYSPFRPAVDIAEVFLWMMAVLTILCASYWSARTTREAVIEQDKLLKDALDEIPNTKYASVSGVVNMNVKAAVLFVVFALCFLFMLYKLMSSWFIDVLVVLFCIGGIELDELRQIYEEQPEFLEEVTFGSRLFEYLRLTTLGVIGASNRTPEFLKMNPIGKVPVLETPDGPVFESNAIARYELHALFHGLSLTWNSGYKSVECDSDSLLALQLVAKGVTTYHPYASIINRICTFKTKQW